MARSKSDKAFDERVAQYSEELRELLTDLYGEQADEAFRNLTELMAKAHDARPADLKRLDTKRLADPEWYKRGNMFGMTMYTDLFAGDLKKLADKVPYLKEQKLTYLHLMPLLKMPHPQNDGGYAVEDFDTVDPSLGTNEDLAALTKKLRAAGISLCLDFVMNHTASSHRWAKAAQAGDPKYQDYYYCHDDRTIPDQYDAVVPEVFPATAPGNFTWNEQMHKWVLTSFYPFQWDLNYRNSNVLVSVLSSVLGLANLGVEVFRIDAVPYIWKELGTNCRNLPQVHAIVRMLRIVLECVCPAVVLKGEVVMAPKELAAYFGTPEKPECHMLYNVSIMVNLWSRLPVGTCACSKTSSTSLTRCRRTAGSSTTCAAMTTSAGAWTSRWRRASASTRSSIRNSCTTSTRDRCLAAGLWESCTTTTRHRRTRAAAAPRPACAVWNVR